MIYMTGDTHADFTRFSIRNFPEQTALNKNDVMIILGDFGGIWDGSKRENYWLEYLEKKNFTILFIAGNHENYDMLKTFPIVPLYGGYARQIRSNIYQLLNGYVFTIEDKKCFAFGGAESHDIDGGVFEPEDKAGIKIAKNNWINGSGKAFRINHVSWWADEIPSQEDMDRGLESLMENNFEVDYVLTHTLPTPVLKTAFSCIDESNRLIRYFNSIYSEITFKHWYSGHYHIDNFNIMGKYHICYENIYTLDQYGRFSSIS